MAGTTLDAPQQHPLLVLTGALEELLDGAVAANAWSMTPGEQAAVLRRLTRAGARLRSVELAVATRADRNRVGDATGATSTGVWWANQTRQTRPVAARLVRLAHALEDEAHWWLWPPTTTPRTSTGSVSGSSRSSLPMSPRSTSAAPWRPRNAAPPRPPGSP